MATIFTLKKEIAERKNIQAVEHNDTLFFLLSSSDEQAVHLRCMFVTAQYFFF
jgi:hypothetical protein